MPRIVIVELHPSGPRVWVARQRVHHGATGAAACVAAVICRHPGLLATGLALMWHDRHDFRDWLRKSRR